jgi:predicted short-subunit dehydrogenase-like oxidoreductase (DUF2520 family)
LGPASALTGPIARGDAGTIARHMEALRAPVLEHIRSLYIQMGLKTLELADKSEAATPEASAEVRRLLKEN